MSTTLTENKPQEPQSNCPHCKDSDNPGRLVVLPERTSKKNLEVIVCTTCDRLPR